MTRFRTARENPGCIFPISNLEGESIHQETYLSFDMTSIKDAWQPRRFRNSRFFNQLGVTSTAVSNAGCIKQPSSRKAENWLSRSGDTGVGCPVCRISTSSRETIFGPAVFDMVSNADQGVMRYASNPEAPYVALDGPIVFMRVRWGAHATILPINLASKGVLYNSQHSFRNWMEVRRLPNAGLLSRLATCRLTWRPVQKNAEAWMYGSASRCKNKSTIIERSATRESLPGKASILGIQKYVLRSPASKFSPDQWTFPCEAWHQKQNTQCDPISHRVSLRIHLSEGNKVDLKVVSCRQVEARVCESIRLALLMNRILTKVEVQRSQYPCSTHSRHRARASKFWWILSMLSPKDLAHEKNSIAMALKWLCGWMGWLSVIREC